jgi:hypothetical protein
VSDEPRDPEELEEPIQRRISVEQFEALLIAIRNGASLATTEFVVEQVTEGVASEASTDDVRNVWHAAEIALALVNPGYLPKREAMFDVFALVRRYPLSEEEFEEEWEDLFGDESEIGRESDEEDE